MHDENMNNRITKLDGVNMDIDLTSPGDQIGWKQDPCPWNTTEDTEEHRYAVKNVSICPYFCGIEYLDNVLCCYPHENPLREKGYMLSPGHRLNRPVEPSLLSAVHWSPEYGGFICCRHDRRRR